jgi:beta-galactosidase
MSIGVCYFPEHWPRERWRTDIEQMAEAGIEYVRMAEFSWSRLEQEPGVFETEWLESVVDLVGEYGMKAVLCTPTATPPKWLVDRHPILQEERDGTVRGFGGRRHYCYNSESYREQTERVVSELAERFADNPTVVGWQTDNEYGCHGTLRCYCDDCAVAFRDWLRETYDSIEDMNESWGTTFWSQRYRSFEEIDPPRHTAADHHPSLLLDYHRFTNDAVADYNGLQVDILRGANEAWFVTHNFMFSDTALDAPTIGDALDFASWDAYPTGAPQMTKGERVEQADLRIGDPDQMGINHDRYRCAAPGDFWVMEQQPGVINWPPLSTQPADGAMRLWAHHAVAHGADVVSYFRWRQCLEGQEQYHSGLRKQDGSADRGYHDAKKAASDFENMELGTIDAPVAIFIDHESFWALDIQPMVPGFDPWEHVETYYRSLRRRGVQVDVVSGDTDLTEYAAVVAPTLYLADDTFAVTLDEYVNGGGALLVTMRSGEKDRFNKLRPQLAPGPFTETIGVTINQHESLSNDTSEAMVSYRDEIYGYRTWAEWLETTDASIDGEYVSGVGNGRTAITLRETADGSCAYVGVWPNDDLADALVIDLLTRAGVDCHPRLPERVRITERGDLRWVFNFGAAPVDLAADVQLGRGTLDAYDFAVFDATDE